MKQFTLFGIKFKQNKDGCFHYISECGFRIRFLYLKRKYIEISHSSIDILDYCNIQYNWTKKEFDEEDLEIFNNDKVIKFFCGFKKDLEDKILESKIFIKDNKKIVQKLKCLDKYSILL